MLNYFVTMKKLGWLCNIFHPPYWWEKLTSWHHKIIPQDLLWICFKIFSRFFKMLITDKGAMFLMWESCCCRTQNTCRTDHTSMRKQCQISPSLLTLATIFFFHQIKQIKVKYKHWQCCPTLTYLHQSWQNIATLVI